MIDIALLTQYERAGQDPPLQIAKPIDFSPLMYYNNTVILKWG